MKKLELYSVDISNDVSISQIDADIMAGFPSPALDFEESRIDLNRELIKNKDATFLGRVKGNSMIEASLNDGDLIIIDRSLPPKTGKIAVCYIDGEFTIKRLKVEKDIVWLMPENKDFKPIKVTHDNDFIVWGIVTKIIKSV